MSRRVKRPEPAPRVSSSGSKIVDDLCRQARICPISAVPFEQILEQTRFALGYLPASRSPNWKLILAP